MSIRQIIFLVIVTMLLVLPVSVFAETKEIIAEGEYIMGDGETMAIAEDRSQKEAARHAAEQAGAFVKSYTKVKNLVLEEDVVEVIAHHSMAITVLEKKRTMVGDAVKFYSKIKAVVTTAQIDANLEKIQKESKIVDMYKRILDEYSRQTKEVEELKKELAVAKGEDRKAVMKKIADEENLFKATLLFEKGVKAMDWGQRDDAHEAFTGAIALNPLFADAYAQRSTLYGNFLGVVSKKGLEDINKAIEIQPENPDFYAVRSMLYPGCSESYRSFCIKGGGGMIGDMKCEEISPDDCKKAFNDIEKAIQMKPESFEYYHVKASLYIRAGMHDRAHEVFTKIISMRQKILESVEWPTFLFVSYQERANFAIEKGDTNAAIDDLTSAITIATNSKYYNKLRKLSNILREAENKKYTDQQMIVAAAKEYNIDPKNEKELAILIKKIEVQAVNLMLLSYFYRKRSDIYKDKGVMDKADRDIKTACELYYDEEVCKTLKKDTKRFKKNRQSESN